MEFPTKSGHQVKSVWTVRTPPGRRTQRRVTTLVVVENQFFQRIPIAVLGLRNQVQIGRFVDHFSKWIEHGCPLTVEEYLLLGHAESICVTIRDRSQADGDKRTARTSETLGYWVLFGKRIPP